MLLNSRGSLLLFKKERRCDSCKIVLFACNKERTQMIHFHSCLPEGFQRRNALQPMFLHWPSGVVCRNRGMDSQQSPEDLGPACFASLLLISVSMGLLLYILNYQNSIQLVIRWFSGILLYDLGVILIESGKETSTVFIYMPSWLEFFPTNCIQSSLISVYFSNYVKNIISTKED